MVCPSSTPVPNISNSKVVRTSPMSVGIKPFTPSRLCRTPAKVLPSLPNCSSNDGRRVTRIVSNQLGLMVLKLKPMSSMAKP